jgi:O-antigen/teichoic acid export membrane protein
VSRRRAAIATLAGTSTSTVIVAIQTIVLVPLYVQAIGSRLYGAWLGSGDILVWLQVFDLGLPNLMIQRIGAAQGSNDEKGATEYFASGMVAMAVISTLIGLTATAAAPLLPRLMGLTGGDAAALRNCFAVSAVAAALNLFTNGIVGYSRAIQKTRFLNVATVIASAVGFAVSLLFILTGAGLWAIAWGLVARHATLFAGGIAFTIFALGGGLHRHFRPRRRMFREFLTILPVTALGGIGYAAMNQSETAVVAIFLKPELATVLALTRKALEVGRGIIDAIAFATYGSFAHLVASDQRHRVLQVHAEVTTVRLSLALVAASAYMAINPSLVAVWVGQAQYGGPLLTILIALQFLVVGASFLANYLYRAMGPVMQGSLALLAEGAARVALMLALVGWLGVVAMPLAGLATGGLFLALSHRWTVRAAFPYADLRPSTPRRVWLARVAVFLAGGLACLFVQWNSWTFVGVAGVVMVLGGAAVLIRLDPLLGGTANPVSALIARLRV